MYTSLITRCSSPFLSVSRPTCNALATPAKEADVGGEDSTSCVWFPWENDQRFGVMHAFVCSIQRVCKCKSLRRTLSWFIGVMRCRGFIHPSILVPKAQGNFIYSMHYTLLWLRGDAGGAVWFLPCLHSPCKWLAGRRKLFLCSWKAVLRRVGAGQNQCFQYWSHFITKWQEIEKINYCMSETGGYPPILAI